MEPQPPEPLNYFGPDRRAPRHEVDRQARDRRRRKLSAIHLVVVTSLTTIALIATFFIVFRVILAK